MDTSRPHHSGLPGPATASVRPPLLRRGSGAARHLFQPPLGAPILLLALGTVFAACDDECCTSPSGDDDAAVASVEVIPAADSIRAGHSIQIEAIARDAQGIALPGRTIYWSPTNGLLVRVDSLGVATGLAVGQTTVTARCEGVEGQATLTITPLPLVLSSIRTGSRHSCGLTALGEAFCWGQGEEGQIGAGFVYRTPFPTLVSGDHSFRQIDTKETFTCGLTTGGFAYCWGRNYYGQLGNGSTENAPTPTPVSGDRQFLSLSTGGGHTCGVTEGGAAYCWGSGRHGELGNGAYSTVAIPVTVRAEGVTFASVKAGGGHTCGLTPSGEAYCWGLGSQGQLGNGLSENRTSPVPVSGALRFRSIHLGNRHTCALTDGGQAYCWGYAADGQIGDGDGVNRLVPTLVAGNLTFSSLSAGFQHTCGVTTDGEAYCWGLGFDGELGNGSTSSSRSPVPVSGGLTFATVSAGGHHTCGVTMANEPYCWGEASDGQLGDGTMAPPYTYGGAWWSSTPVRVAGG